MNNNEESERYIMEQSNTAHMEPRVARLEVGLETLTKNVNDIVIAMRENSLSTNTKIDNLAIAVTQASAPRKTDWNLLLTLGFFILAIGSAVFWPLNKSSYDNKVELDNLSTKIEHHIILDAHPVSAVRFAELEKKYEENRTEMVNRDKELNTKIQRETQLMTDLISARLLALNVSMDLKFGRIDRFMEHQDFGDLDELRQWRAKANGLSSPNMTTPLIPKEIEPSSIIRK